MLINFFFVERTVSRKIASSSRSESENEQKPDQKTAKVESLPVAPIFNLKANASVSQAANTSDSYSLMHEIREKRTRLYGSINEFKFNKKRVRVLSEAGEFPDYSKGILYWMSRDQRVQGFFNFFLF